jgi:hypothetical protein
MRDFTEIVAEAEAKAEKETPDFCKRDTDKASFRNSMVKSSMAVRIVMLEMERDALREKIQHLEKMIEITSTKQG